MDQRDDLDDPQILVDEVPELARATVHVHATSINRRDSGHQRSAENAPGGSVDLCQEARHLLWRLDRVPVSCALDVSVSGATKVKLETQVP